MQLTSCAAPGHQHTAWMSPLVRHPLMAHISTPSLLSSTRLVECIMLPPLLLSTYRLQEPYGTAWLTQKIYQHGLQVDTVFNSLQKTQGFSCDGGSHDTFDLASMPQQRAVQSPIIHKQHQTHSHMLLHDSITQCCIGVGLFWLYWQLPLGNCFQVAGSPRLGKLMIWRGYIHHLLHHFSRPLQISHSSILEFHTRIDHVKGCIRLIGTLHHPFDFSDYCSQCSVFVRCQALVLCNVRCLLIFMGSNAST